MIKSRNRKMKKLGEVILGVGFFGLFLFISALDGPGNNMAMVCGGILFNLALMGIGNMMSGEVE